MQYVTQDLLKQVHVFHSMIQYFVHSNFQNSYFIWINNTLNLDKTIKSTHNIFLHFIEIKYNILKTIHREMYQNELKLLNLSIFNDKRSILLFQFLYNNRYYQLL